MVAILPFSLQRHFLLDVIQTLVCVPNVHSEINQWFQNEVSQLPKNEVNQLLENEMSQLPKNEVNQLLKNWGESVTQKLR